MNHSAAQSSGEFPHMLGDPGNRFHVACLIHAIKSISDATKTAHLGA